MRKICIVLSVLALCGSTAFSQSWLDAYKYAPNDLSGTARYLSMGGAFGALGGDISSMNSNPAGLAVYRSSEVVATLSLSAVGTETNWLGVGTNGNRTRLSFDNIAYVGYFPTSNDAGIVGWNVGFSYNRVKNFSRNYSMSNNGGMHTSLSDYVAARAFGTPVSDLAFSEKYNPYGNNTVDWMSALGYDAGFIDAYNDNTSDYYSSMGDVQNGNWVPYNIDGANLNVSERGSINQYNFAFGMNISDLVMLGATVAVTDLDYNFSATYDEFFSHNSDLYLDNGLSTDGTGYSFNVGAIIRPTNFLRLGVAYNSPTWYKMTDYYYGEAGSYLTFVEDGKETVRDIPKSNTPDDGPYTDYEYRSPDKWIFSAAAIIGTTALISVDYELMNYKNMKMYNQNGIEKEFVSDDIESFMQSTNTVRIGAEVKITPQFSVRAGTSFSNSPMKNPFEHIVANGVTEVFTVGTIPNFVIDKGVTNYTVGLGYRFTPNFYTDIACVFRTQKADAYAFSGIYENGEAIIEPQSASLKTNTTKVALTLGYKF